MSSNINRSIPWTIIFFFVFLGTMLFGILYVSIKYIPVNMVTPNFQSYQNYDKNYNEYYQQQQEFDARYDVSIDIPLITKELVEVPRVNGTKEYFEHALRLGENRIAISVQSKDGTMISDAELRVQLTRFETNDYNQELVIEKSENGTYYITPFTIEKAGRWNFVVRVGHNEFVGFKERGVFAK